MNLFIYTNPMKNKYQNINRWIAKEKDNYKLPFSFDFKRLFSQNLLLLEGEKANCHCFHVETAYYF